MFFNVKDAGFELEVNSLKCNGNVISNFSFVMPEENVVITDVSGIKLAIVDEIQQILDNAEFVPSHISQTPFPNQAYVPWCRLHS